MSTIKGPLINRLKTFTQVANVAGGRVYANRLPQEADLPAVVVRLTEKDRNQHLGGHDDSLIMDEFDIVTYAYNSSQAELIGDSIASTLENVEGEVISDANTNVSRTLEAVLIRDERDDVIPMGDESDRDIHEYVIETQIQHSPGS